MRSRAAAAGKRLGVASASGAGSQGTGLAPVGVSRYDVTWESASKDSLGSMPLGNGETGLNVWVEEDGDLLFYIGRSDAFCENHKNVKLGRVRVRFTPNPFTRGVPFRQKLELENGRIKIDSGPESAALHLSLWVDANRPVAWVQGISVTPVAVRAEYEMWRPLNSVRRLDDPGALGGDVLLDDGAARLAWYHRNATSVWSERLRAEGLAELVAGKVEDPLLHLTFGGMISGPGFRRSGSRSLETAGPVSRFDLSVHFHAGRYEHPREWLDALERQAEASHRTAAAAAWAAHQAWWREFWNRSWINIGGPGITRTISERYAHQRFINACSNRGRYPVMYNGSIFTTDLPAGTPTFFGLLPKAVDADYRAWGDLPIMWQNTRHPYWPMLASGDYDLMPPVLDLCRDSLEVCKARARVWYNQDGMLMPEAMLLAGVSRFARKIPQHLVYHRTGMIEMSNMLCDYYAYTGDERFARETVLPFTEAVITFFEQHYPKRDERGRMVMGPAGAVETYQPTVNSATEAGGLARLLDQLLAIAPGMTGPARRSRWTSLGRIIPDVPVRTVMGQKLIAVAEDAPAGREICEAPELYSVWPFRQATHWRDELLAAARQGFAVHMMSLDGTNDKQAYETGGWLYTAADAAYLNLPAEAARLVAQNFGDNAPWITEEGTGPPLGPGHTGQPRFAAFWETRMDYIPDQCHGGASAHGLQSMLLQSEGRAIYLLPAWPEGWDVCFKLHAPMRTTVECEYHDGRIVSLRVTPESRRKDVVDMTTAVARLRTLVSVACADHNYLFGIPPMKDGQAGGAKALDPWLATYGETLRGIAGPFPPAAWGGSIARGSSIYLHLLRHPGETLVLPPLGAKILSAKTLVGSRAKLQRQDDSGVVLDLATPAGPEPDTIVELRIDGDAEALTRDAPYAGSLTRGAVARASGKGGASLAIDGNALTAWRPAAGGVQWLEVDLGGARTFDHAQVHFDVPGGPYRRKIELSLEYQDERGEWRGLWQGTSYSRIWARRFVPVRASVVRLKTDAQAVRQFDLFPLR
jgi:hypothetical protein